MILTTKDTRITKVGRMMSQSSFHRFSFVPFRALCGESLCDDSMNTFSNKGNIDHLHVAKVCFGGDIAL